MNQNYIFEIESDIDRIKQILTLNVDFNNNDIKDAVIKYISCPSKFLRPSICCLMQRALYKDMDENVLLIAAAVELAHNASLLHDDVIDNSEMRRNSPSFNFEFGSKAAILTGDWMLSRVMSILNTVNKKELYKMFSDSVQNMTEGELIQLFDRYNLPSLNDYYEKNQKKTGQLFRIAVLAPLILHNDFKYYENATKFADAFANAFQIADDISDYFGLCEDKLSNKDKENGIYTLPDILAQTCDGANLYEECCKNLEHQVNLSVESLAFVKNSVYKDAIVSLCHSLLKD